MFAAILTTLALAQPPAPPPGPAVTEKTLPGVGKVVFVSREAMRAGPGVKSARLPKGVREAVDGPSVTIPKTWDWTKANTISFPILGNDQYGICYPAACCHLFQSLVVMAGGPPVVFDRTQLVRRYLQIAGGDNGTTDDQMMPELFNGHIGPNGPYKILDRLIVSPTDAAAVDLTQYAFGPQLYTCSLLDTWQANSTPGALWDGNGRPDPRAGHAILLTGKNGRGNYSLQTWGFNPPVEVTPRGIAVSYPEIISVFSLHWFDKAGFAPNGLHYTTLAPLWESLGGKKLPASPFPPPPAPTPPSPIPVPPEPVTPPAPPAPVAFPPYDVTVTGHLPYLGNVTLTGTAKPRAANAPAVSRIGFTDWLKIVRFIKAVITLAEQTFGDTPGQPAAALPVGLSIADVQKWLPVILREIELVAPVILDGLAQGKTVPAVVLDVIRALIAGGLGPVGEQPAALSAAPAEQPPAGLVPPGPGFRWRTLPGVGPGWVQDGLAPTFAAPRVASPPQPMPAFRPFGGLFAPMCGPNGCGAAPRLLFR